MQVAHVWKILEAVKDPEVPVLSIIDLGIVRAVHCLPFADGDIAEVTITPTYSGCPAMGVIAANIRMELLAAGFVKVELKTQLSPVWTTDWMSDAGKLALQAYGIAAPISKASVGDVGLTIPCPQCNSENTIEISRFGSTACKALYRCKDCLEPFDYFKCH